MNSLCKNVGVVEGKHFQKDNSLGYITLEMINGATWKLYDDSNPRFNVWIQTFTNGNTIKECFDKFIEPCWFHKYRHYGQSDRAVLIRMMYSEGYDFEGIKAALGICGYEIKRLLEKYPYKGNNLTSGKNDK